MILRTDPDPDPRPKWIEVLSFPSYMAHLLKVGQKLKVLYWDGDCPVVELKSHSNGFKISVTIWRPASEA